MNITNTQKAEIVQAVKTIQALLFEAYPGSGDTSVIIYQQRVEFVDDECCVVSDTSPDEAVECLIEESKC